MTGLRDYQIKLIQDLRKSLVNHKRIIACAATGSGKTKTFVAMVRMVLERNATRPEQERSAVLILTESTKIFKQIRQEQHGRLISAGTHQLIIEKSGVYVAMVQTLSRRPGMISQFRDLGKQLVIINDEAHIGTSTKLLMAILKPALESPWSETTLIGFTATPDARSGKHLPDLYEETIIGPQPAELVAAGWLSPYRHIARVGADTDVLKLQNGEFTEASQELAFETPRVYDGLTEDLRTIPYKKCVIYTASIKHCEDVLQQLTAAGFVAVSVHSLSEGDPLSAFMFGNIDICVTVAMLTKGWDYPPSDLIVFLRATNSLPLFLQVCGRGSRLSPETGKTHFTVLDYGENYKRHGLWDMERDWVKMSKTVKRKKDGVTPIKHCPQCDAIVKQQTKVCPVCGYEFPVEEKEPEATPESKLVEITAQYAKLTGRLISTLNPEELALYARIKSKQPYAGRIACAHEQESPGWLKAYGAAMGYKPYWAIIRAEQLPTDKIEYHDITLR